MILRATSLCALGVACVLAACAPRNNPELITITIVGTNDVHGALVANEETGGLAVFSGYVERLRQLRAANGALLLIDAGDMWQGTLESNLTEGASVVEIYNTLGYDAAAIGNHEFDFGPAGSKAVPDDPLDDPQGALKARAAEAQFPLLAANVIDAATGRAVAWPNTSPTTVIDAAGVSIGVIGGTTENTLATTVAANTNGIAIAPLAETIAGHARQLRDSGVDLVMVTVHAGGRCQEFSDPRDHSSCTPDSEVFRLANALSPGLVDIIVAGHTHQRVAHFVNDIAIISSWPGLRTFARLDIEYDIGRQHLTAIRIYPPQLVCEYRQHGADTCADETAPRARYEGVEVSPVPSIAGLIDDAVEDVEHFKKRGIGVELTEPMLRSSVPESAIGNLLTDILLETSESAQLAIHNTVGGIRADLPAGALTFGDIFEIFPFDNRVVDIQLTGRQVREIFRNQLQSTFWRAGLSGGTVSAQCVAGQLDVSITLRDGSVVEDDDQLIVASNDFLATGGDRIFTPVTPPGGFEFPSTTPLFRDQIVQWLSKRGGQLRPGEFYLADSPRYVLPGPVPVNCQ